MIEYTEPTKTQYRKIIPALRRISKDVDFVYGVLGKIETKDEYAVIIQKLADKELQTMDEVLTFASALEEERRKTPYRIKRRHTTVAKSIKVPNGHGTHVTDPRYDNTEVLGLVAATAAVGESVYYTKFGYGKIVDILEVNGVMKLEVSFDNHPSFLVMFDYPSALLNRTLVKKRHRKSH